MWAFARWRALSRHDKRLALHAAVVTSIAAAGLRSMGAGRMLRLANRRVSGRGLTAQQIHDRAIAVDRAGRYVPGGTCLSKSLALAWVLRGRGVPASTRLGVRTEGGFAAHAWVEIDGAPLAESPAEFAPLPAGRT